MTPEQLDAIEKLAEAATPGPWARTHSAEVADLWADGGAIPILRAWSDRDIEFIAAMREYALLLVKALREAMEDARNQREDALAWMEACYATFKERDEARAERDKYKAALDAELPAAWREDIESLNSCLERIGKERDEARAEVKRLQAQVEWLLEGREQQEQRLALEVGE